MKNDNFIILINKNAVPVLIEASNNADPDTWFALEDESHHIRFKDEAHAKRVVSESNNGTLAHYAVASGQTFPLPSNVSVSFEYLCNECRLAQGCGKCAIDNQVEQVAFLTESTTKQEPLEDQKQEGNDAVGFAQFLLSDF